MSYTKHENGMRTWPTLYKKGAKAEQQWDLAVIPIVVSAGNSLYGNAEDITHAFLRVQHGQVDGKIQTSSVYFEKGKNIGRSNETTPLEQATQEAEAKWLKQKDKGYAEIRGGGSMELKPMLAHKYEDCKKHVIYPSLIQPKLDGVRAIAVREGDNIRLISRQGKEHVGLNHIRSTLLKLMSEGDVLDGELYVHGMPFQKLISLVKKDQPESQQVQYHVYDCIMDDKFVARSLRVAEIIEPSSQKKGFGPNATDPVLCVETQHVGKEEDVEHYHSWFVESGYEGAMLRVGACTYTPGYRSRELLKVKAFKEDDFLIVDVVPGVGKMENQGIFVCETTQGRTFNVKPKGRDSLRQRYLAERNGVIGKMLTVIYFSMTDGDNPVPRFPVGKAVRDYE